MGSGSLGESLSGKTKDPKRHYYKERLSLVNKTSSFSGPHT